MKYMLMLWGDEAVWDQLGFYITEAKDLDEALELATYCPMEAAIEVRPIWEMPS